MVGLLCVCVCRGGEGHLNFLPDMNIQFGTRKFKVSSSFEGRVGLTSATTGCRGLYAEKQEGLLLSNNLLFCVGDFFLSFWMSSSCPHS